MVLRFRLPPTTALLTAVLIGSVSAQERQLNAEDLIIRVEPPSLQLSVGDTTQLQASVVDVGGRPVEATVFFFSRDRRSVAVDRSGKVLARRPGEFEIIARVAGRRRGGPSATIPVSIAYPEPAAIKFGGAPTTIYVGTTVRITPAVVDASGRPREDLEPKLTTANARIATVDAFGYVTGVAPGAVRLTAAGGGLESGHAVQVLPNPVTKVSLTPSATVVRTGDVVTLDVGTVGASDAPVQLAVYANPDDNLGQGATGQVDQDGRFVAETPGLYTIVATCGSASARHTIRVNERFPEKQKLEFVGHGEVLDTHTSDLWVWEGVDGRDYAVTGTWGANGDAHFWDVTDPENMQRIATVRVDARTVNDVKVSKDGRLCVLSREGASNRKNGIVLLDVIDPRQPKIISTFDDELTGGVHNLFVDRNHIYALSAGRRYDVINIDDPAVPVRVGSFQLFEPGASIHDVWVENGIAYSSNWRYGLQLVDVGNGIAGGSPSKPVRIGNYAYPSGWNHAAFPYKSKETGKFYVIAGDEAFPYGLHVRDKPTYPRGWLHFVDFTDMKNPKEVARFQVPEAGTHNLWVEGDILYAAFYNGGVRVVDISGDLMGDLYRQGREIAWFLPTHKEGVVPNAPMTWGPQPHKGHIFFSDWNSGLWAVKLVPDTRRRR